MTLASLVEEIVNKLDRYNVQECLQYIGTNMIEFLGADACSFFLYNENQNELFVAKAIGDPPLMDQNARMPLGKGIAGYVARNKKPLCFSDVQNDDEFTRIGLNGRFRIPERQKDCRAVLAVPLLAFGGLIGVLELANRTPGTFSEKDMERLQPLVNIAALAIPRALTDNSLAKLAEICVRFLEEKDRYTHGHSIRVMRYALLLADEISLPERDKEELRVCSLLHDIGKVILKDSILSKEGRLSKLEYDTVKMHTSIGSSIASKISKGLGQKILSHHEHFDGTGYPGGLRSEKIPMLSRIIAIADTFDAITSTRPYREMGTIENAINEIHAWSGMQFDPILVSAFMRLYRNGKLKVEHT